MEHPAGPAEVEAAVTDDEDMSPSIQLAIKMQEEEMAASMQAMQQPDFGDDLDDETRQSLELAWRLQEEERTRLQEQADAEERLQNEPEDAESIALAIRLQQEDDETALRNALGVQGDDGEPVSPSQYSYEQLMRLQDTVGMVSKGASSDDISALTRTLTVADSRTDSSVILGEQVPLP